MPLAEAKDGTQVVSVRSWEAKQYSNSILAPSSGPGYCIEMRSMLLKEAEVHTDTVWPSRAGLEKMPRFGKGLRKAKPFASQT
jgi:hypothetical protein